MADQRDQIVTFLRQNGPSIAQDIKKVIPGDSFIAGAVLSDLRSRGILLVTQVKKGGSPFYYLAGQEEQLEPLVEFLNAKDQQTVRRLKQERVFNEANEELFIRLSLRQIPDFAKPFMVQTPQGVYRCWRYYLTSEQQARQLLAPPQPEIVSEDTQPKALAQEIQPTVSSPQEALPEKPVPPVRAPSSLPEESAQTPSPPKPLPATVIAPLSKPPQDYAGQKNLSITPELEATAFYKALITYFQDSEITLHREEQLSKDREYNFTVTTPTAVGPLKMYVHARNKKKLNEGDVAPALLKAKSVDLPCLYLYQGDFTKKALEIIAKEYKGIILKKLK